MGRQLAWLACAWACAALTGSAAAETISLANGNQLDGEVLERTGQLLVLQHENLGRLEIPVDQLAVETAKPGLFGTDFLRGWDRRLELGVNGADGNSDFLNAHGGLALGFEDDFHRWAIDGAYRYNEQDGENDANNAFLQLVKDWLHPDREWFPFVDARYDFDEFQDWDHRLGGHAGIGHHLVETERFQLIGRAGVGASRTWGAVDDRTAPEALLGLQGEWQIDDRQCLTFYSKLYPDLGELGEYRNLSGAAWIVDINDELSLKLGVDNRYESDVDDDSKNNDLRYLGSLLIGF